MAGPTPKESDFIFEVDTTGIAVDSFDQNDRSEENGVTDTQRWAITTLYDTQDPRRKKYLRNLGFETKPGDLNQYRPIDSVGEYRTIDPGLFESFARSFKDRSFLLKETGRDIQDLAFDIGIAGPIIAASASQGSLIGGGTGFALGGGLTPTGMIAGVAGGLAGLVGGAFTGNLAAEKIKEGMGNFLVDDSNIPMDMREAVLQSVSVGLFALGGEIAGSQLAKLRKLNAKETQEFLERAASESTSGNMTRPMFKKMMDQPENFTKKATKDSAENTREVLDSLFGTSEISPRISSFVKSKSEIGQAMSRVKNQADLEKQILSDEPAANWSFEEITEVLTRELDPIQSKFKKNKNDVKIVKSLKNALKNVDEKTRVNTSEVKLFDAEGKLMKLPAVRQELDYGIGRKVLEDLQEELFEILPQKATARGKQVQFGLRELADKKAASVGSRLPELNAKMSRVMEVHKNLPKNLKKIFIGGDDEAKILVRRQIKAIDDDLNTNLTDAVESAQFNQVMENFFNNPKQFSKKGMLKNMASEAIREGKNLGIAGGVIGSTLLGPVGAAKGGALGAVAGIIKGSNKVRKLSSAEKLAENLQKQSRIQSTADELSGQILSPRLKRNTGLIPATGLDRVLPDLQERTVGPRQDTAQIEDEPLDRDPTDEDFLFDVESPLPLDQLPTR